METFHDDFDFCSHVKQALLCKPGLQDEVRQVFVSMETAGVLRQVACPEATCDIVKRRQSKAVTQRFEGVAKVLVR